MSSASRFVWIVVVLLCLVPVPDAQALGGGDSSGVLIKNGISGDGAWEVLVDNGGQTTQASLDPPGVTGPADVVFAYLVLVDSGHDGLAFPIDATVTTPAFLSDTNEVTSSGSFAGPKGTINWTSIASIAVGSSVFVNALTFSSAQPFGEVRIVSYLDEDLAPIVTDCRLVVLGSPGATDFQLLTVDGATDLGVTQSAGFDSLSGAVFAGWAADKFADLFVAMEGPGAVFSPQGSVDTTDLPPITDPRFPGSSVFGPGDVTSGLAFDLDPNAFSAYLIFALGGVPEPSNPPPPVVPPPDLSITKTDSPDPVIAGNQLTYLLNVTNNGASQATGVTVTDILPGGAVFVSVSPSQGTCAHSNGTVTCNLGSLAGGSSASATLIVSAPVSGGTFTNTASVSGNEQDPLDSNNTATSMTTVTPAADLEVSQSDSLDPIAAGQEVTYEISVANQGPSTATGVRLFDRLPGGTSFVSSSGMANCSLSGTLLTCNLGGLAAAATRTIEIVVRTSSDQSGGRVSNVASVSADELDLNSSNNSTSEPTQINRAVDLAVSIFDFPDPVPVGDPLTYQLSVTNIGPSDSEGGTLIDTPPESVVVVSIPPECTESDGFITCAVAGLAEGGHLSFSITVTPLTTGNITNAATINLQGDESDPDESNNTASVDTTVVPAPVTCELARTLAVLDANARGIENLGGLEFFFGLETVLLADNSISDISPLVANPGLGRGDLVDLRGNPLDEGDCPNLQALIDRGAEVRHDVTCPQP
ncbi:MAG: hypothetical protein ACE5JX_12345 [Acidobacteriota bacterium]